MHSLTQNMLYLPRSLFCYSSCLPQHTLTETIGITIITLGSLVWWGNQPTVCKFRSSLHTETFSSAPSSIGTTGLWELLFCLLSLLCSTPSPHMNIVSPFTYWKKLVSFVWPWWAGNNVTQRFKWFWVLKIITILMSGYWSKLGLKSTKATCFLLKNSCIIQNLDFSCLNFKSCSDVVCGFPDFYFVMNINRFLTEHN